MHGETEVKSSEQAVPYEGKCNLAQGDRQTLTVSHHNLAR